ncbi:MAG: sigma-70 family RNA polymerase sigma factor [Planctomycetes bacterium]|nr:sigma-70 family RNA polymerase sigma factor [Planctomycetota bacterium]
MTTPADLDQLVRALREARRDLGALLQDELLRRVRALCSQRLASGDRLRGSMDSEDLTQDVLIDLIDAIEEFRGRSWQEFFAFVDALVGRRKVQHARRLGAAKRGGFAAPAALPSEVGANPSGTPSRAAANAEERERAGQLLAGLPEEERLPIQWRLMEELSYAEIAARLGISEEAARQRVSRGLRRLKERW